MAARPRNIRITIRFDGHDKTFMTFPGEYRSLMTLIYDNFYTEEFGECKGVGRCGTCHVKILNSTAPQTKVGNEKTTLAKLSNSTEQSRLACQMLITEEINGIVVEIVNENEPYKGY